jgi:hypothetical protein
VEGSQESLAPQIVDAKKEVARKDLLGQRDIVVGGRRWSRLCLTLDVHCSMWRLRTYLEINVDGRINSCMVSEGQSDEFCEASNARGDPRSQI